MPDAAKLDTWSGLHDDILCPNAVVGCARTPGKDLGHRYAEIVADEIHRRNLTRSHEVVWARNWILRMEIGLVRIVCTCNGTCLDTGSDFLPIRESDHQGLVEQTLLFLH